MSKRSNKKNKKINRPVPVAPQDDYQDFEGEDLNDGSHFGPYEEYEFVDHANSELNTKFENHFIDNSKVYKDFYKPRPIFNYDFYNAYREYREMEKKYSSDSFIETNYFGSYDIYKHKKKYAYDKAKTSKLSIDRFKKPDQSPWFDRILMIVSGIIAVIVLSGIIVNFAHEFKMTKFIIFLAVSGAVFGLIMLIKWAINKDRYNRLKDQFNDSKKSVGDNTPDVHPYVKLCSNLIFMEDKGIKFVYPTKQIDENYRRNKNHIEAEWEISSHKFITNRFFRMKAFDCHFPNYTHYRFFVEVKYEDCFPDYPELINIEKQLEFLPFIPKDDIRPKASLANYKSMIKKKVAELISERIPKMKVREVVVASGCTEHNTVHKRKKFKDAPDKPFFMESECEKDNKIILKNEFYENLENHNLLKK